MKCSNELLQKLLYFMFLKEIHAVFFVCFPFRAVGGNGKGKKPKLIQANFEAFHWNISLRANLLFLKGFPATLTCTNIGGFSKSNISVRMFIWKVLSITIFLSLGFSVYRIHHYDVLSHYK